MKLIAITLLFCILSATLYAGEKMSPEEMEQSIYILRWAIAKLAIELMDVLIEVQRSDSVGPHLKGRAEEAIGTIYQILEVLGIRTEA
jgi:hypothetical protein